MEVINEDFSVSEEEGARSSVFSELKHHCIQVMDLLQNPMKNPAPIFQLLQFLRRSSTESLQPFLDYTLFPLLFLLDAAVDCRSPAKDDSEDRSRIVSVPWTPYKVSDAVAEGVLQCLEELLSKCHLGTLDQMAVVMKKFTSGALLSPSVASEEFREGVIRSFRALLLRLHLCSSEDCSCKQINGRPALSKNKDLRPAHTRISKHVLQQEECLLAFLCSQAASAAVGHWFSLLLTAADTEAARGNRGSSKLRVEAFMTLRVLVTKVGTADALAFFLPGVVSKLGKVLHTAKTMISGAAGSVEAVDQAIRGLAEFLMIVLKDDDNSSNLGMPITDTYGSRLSKEKSPMSFLQGLRQLPVNVLDQSEISVKDSSGETRERNCLKSGCEEKSINEACKVSRSLHVNRTKDWIMNTSVHVDKLLSATFPHLCVHPSQKVRRGLLAAIQGLISNCIYTLKDSRLMLLECVCILACDDSEEVSTAAQLYLEYLFSSSGRYHVEYDAAEIFSKLVEKLPEMVLGSEESLALSHAQKLLVLIFYSGPQLVADYVLQSPVMAARFLDLFAVCLSQNSLFAGSLDKLTISLPSSTGYLRSIAEMKASIVFNDDQRAYSAEGSKFPGSQNKRTVNPLANMDNEYELPRMPPWFVYVGSQKLYQALAGILRLVGLALAADTRIEGSLSVIVDIPLNYLRNLVSEVRMKEYNKESWQSWYHRTDSGRLLRQASTAACILNEIVFGLSEQGVDAIARLFHKSKLEEHDASSDDSNCCKSKNILPHLCVWSACQEKGARSELVDCIGRILHEYISPEVWDLPLENKPQQSDTEAGDSPLHFLHDNAMLRQVIIDGIGISTICLGKDFSSCGFLRSSLYVLLENLICSNFQIRSASDAVLHVVSSTSGYPTVGHLVLANSDYVIDSVCRQLRHLDLNPHVPNVLAAMLSYVGVAYKILPLLEEPMHSVSIELEILGRHQHPDLTVPFLKALAEISKASKHEACLLPAEEETYSKHVSSKISNVENKVKERSGCSTAHYNGDIDSNPMQLEAGTWSSDIDMNVEQWESICFKLNDFKRYRRTVGAIAGSCVTAAIPLLTSDKQAASLVALDIVLDGITGLAKVEEAYRHERETKEAIERVLQLFSSHDLLDALGAAEDGTQENILLPAMNKTWPFLVACVRNKNFVVVRRCLGVISNVVHLCGGDFFCRRFHTDGRHIWKLLTASPFQKKPPISSEEKGPLQLPYRSGGTGTCMDHLPEESMAEVSNLKVQAAVLNMIADISRNKASAPALEAVLKKVSALVVGIACSGVTGLRDASVNALMGLASMDPDLIWLLLADVYYSYSYSYSVKKEPTPSSNFPEISQIFPPPPSPKGYLYVQYGGQTYGFDVDFTCVEIVFQKLLASQVY